MNWIEFGPTVVYYYLPCMELEDWLLCPQERNTSSSPEPDVPILCLPTQFP